MVIQLKSKTLVIKGVGCLLRAKLKKGEICCWYDGIVCLSASINVACLANGCHGYLQAIDEDANLAGFVQPFQMVGWPKFATTLQRPTKTQTLLTRYKRSVESTIFSEETLVAVFAGNDFTLKGYVQRIGIVKAMVCEHSMRSQASKHA